ncbi:hypothetical protein [Burkholderia aenigmatica]|uniref:hypothetical protein n=1 Tax=Burkholderia aenigmatica TaxID=2015348 RepID=UPI001583BBBE|nr:hypothetical protein [Burkholderia aenigmatica]
MSNTGNEIVDRFFAHNGYRIAVESDWDLVTIEELYQMFKLRMELERSESEDA